MLEVTRRLHADKIVLPAVADIMTPISSESSQVVSQYFPGLITDLANSLITTRTLRLGTIICGYLLLRPYLLKFGASMWHSNDDKSTTHDTPNAPVPNTWRIHCIDKSDEEDSGDDEATNWGRRARRRQRGWVTRRVDEAQTQGYGDAMDTA